jgi:hypothetical protein
MQSIRRTAILELVASALCKNPTRVTLYNLCVLSFCFKQRTIESFRKLFFYIYVTDMVYHSHQQADTNLAFGPSAPKMPKIISSDEPT